MNDIKINVCTTFSRHDHLVFDNEEIALIYMLSSDCVLYFGAGKFNNLKGISWIWWINFENKYIKKNNKKEQFSSTSMKKEQFFDYLKLNFDQKIIEYILFNPDIINMNKSHSLKSEIIKNISDEKILEEYNSYFEIDYSAWNS